MGIVTFLNELSWITILPWNVISTYESMLWSSLILIIGTWKSISQIQEWFFISSSFLALPWLILRLGIVIFPVKVELWHLRFQYCSSAICIKHICLHNWKDATVTSVSKEVWHQKGERKKKCIHWSLLNWVCLYTYLIQYKLLGDCGMKWTVLFFIWFLSFH